MGERELREKYGGKLAKAINRAIRAEIPGGNEALDTLTRLAGPARQSHWEDKVGQPTPEAAAYFKHQRDVVDRMEAQIRQAWGVPPARPAGKRPPPRQGHVKPRRPAGKKSDAAGAKRPAGRGPGPSGGGKRQREGREGAK